MIAIFMNKACLLQCKFNQLKIVDKFIEFTDFVKIFSIWNLMFEIDEKIENTKSLFQILFKIYESEIVD